MYPPDMSPTATSAHPADVAPNPRPPKLINIEPLSVDSDEAEELCQIDSAMNAGTMRRPGFLYVLRRIKNNWKERGFFYTFRVTLRGRIEAVRAMIKGPPPVRPTPYVPDAVLELEAGELVEVKTLQEIMTTLDGKGRYKGLVFTPEMAQHCGKQYRVFKRLELMFDEYHKSQRRVKNTVLLENVVCQGAGLGCHRSCFLYWREAWLRRVS